MIKNHNKKDFLLYDGAFFKNMLAFLLGDVPDQFALVQKYVAEKVEEEVEDDSEADSESYPEDLDLSDFEEVSDSPDE